MVRSSWVCVLNQKVLGSNPGRGRSQNSGIQSAYTQSLADISTGKKAGRHDMTAPKGGGWRLTFSNHKCNVWDRLTDMASFPVPSPPAPPPPPTFCQSNSFRRFPFVYRLSCCCWQMEGRSPVFLSASCRFLRLKMIYFDNEPFLRWFVQVE